MRLLTEMIMKRNVNVTVVHMTHEQYALHRKEMHERYIASLKQRISEWKAKIGYSDKMDAWCDKNIDECMQKLIKMGGK